VIVLYCTPAASNCVARCSWPPRATCYGGSAAILAACKRCSAAAPHCPPRVLAQVDVKAALLATAGSVLLMAGAAGAKPIRLAELNAEKAALRDQQLAVMEAALRQQESERVAELAAQ
jgi:hypothetical protein